MIIDRSCDKNDNIKKGTKQAENEMAFNQVFMSNSQFV